MLHRKLAGVLFGLLVVGLASLASAGVPDMDLSVATMDAAANGASVFNLPNGEGDALTQAKNAAGQNVDATITLVLVDSNGDPIPLYPSEDMWLETSGGGLVHCPNGTAANLSTNFDGETSWSNPLFAGGHSEGETVEVMISGTALNQTGLNLTFNSADINADLNVNLSDLTPFSTDFFGDYNYRSDLVRDGDIGLSDLTQFARGNQGGECP